MSRGRPREPLVLNEEQRAHLLRLAHSGALPHGLVQRAQIVLASADGKANTAIAKRLGLNKNTVDKWHKRYVEFGIEGLHE